MGDIANRKEYFSADTGIYKITYNTDEKYNFILSDDERLTMTQYTKDDEKLQVAEIKSKSYRNGDFILQYDDSLKYLNLHRYIDNAWYRVFCTIKCEKSFNMLSELLNSNNLERKERMNRIQSLLRLMGHVYIDKYPYKITPCVIVNVNDIGEYKMTINRDVKFELIDKIIYRDYDSYIHNYVDNFGLMVKRDIDLIELYNKTNHLYTKILRIKFNDIDRVKDVVDRFKIICELTNNNLTFAIEASMEGADELERINSNYKQIGSELIALYETITNYTLLGICECDSIRIIDKK